MATTLTYGVTTITLDDGMLWTDEFGWQGVAMSQARTIAGSLIVESAARAKGRPITLAGGQNHGWLPRSTLLALRAAADIVGQTFTLLLRGATYAVVFNNEGSAIEASPVIDYSDPEAEDHYIVTLRFLEVEA